MPGTSETKKQYFAPSEFACKCGCGKNNINPDLVALLNEARGLSGQPYALNSACRCQRHNQSVGGVSDSSHLSGSAVDISIASDRQRGAILYGLITAGFRRIGIGKTFIHADIDPNKAGAVWVY